MKKLVSLALVLVLAVCCLSVAAADQWRVFDNAGLLTAAEKSDLEDSIRAFQQETNMDFVFLSTDDYLADDPFTVATFFWDNGPYGLGKSASGVIYYIDMYHCIPTIATTGDAVQLLDGHYDALYDDSYDALSQGKYYDAIKTILDESKALLVSK